MSSEKVNDERKIDLANNVQAGIHWNPLHDIPRDKLLSQVEDFACEKDSLEAVDVYGLQERRSSHTEPDRL